MNINQQSIQSIKIPARNVGIYFMCSPKDSNGTMFLIKKFPIDINDPGPIIGSCTCCMFHINSTRELCFKHNYEGLPSCEDGIFKKLPLHDTFEELYFEITQELFHPLVYTKLEELHTQLITNAKSLYISTYNPLITKRLLTILKKPTYFGYDLILSVRNDELIINYRWNQ